MKLVFFTVIASAFISLGCSIECYQCIPGFFDGTVNCSSYTADQCDKKQIRVYCPQGLNLCMRSSLHGASVDIEKRSCASERTCGSAKVYCEHHRKTAGVTCDWSCCDKDLCNASVHLTAQCLMLVVIACLLSFFNVYNL
ncbi:hypothetical protein ACROYT_G007948 [Oculina patagonica]